MCVGGSFPGATVTSTRKKAPFVSFDSARFVVKHPIYHLDSSSDLPRLNAFKFKDVAFTIAVSFIFPPLRCTTIRTSDLPIKSSLRWSRRLIGYVISFHDGGIKRLSLEYS